MNPGRYLQMNIYMKNLKYLLPLLFVMPSCKKEIVTKDPVNDKQQAKLEVKCDNCLIGYGMPDQYRAFDQAGVSPVSYAYTYSDGYDLRVRITAVDHDQDINLTIYDTSGKAIYTNKTTQSTEGFWEVSVPLTTNN